MRLRELTNLFLAVASLSLMSFGARIELVADATCQIRMEYSGDFPNPTWTGEGNCIPQNCPVSGACDVAIVSSSPDLVIEECQCPSGGE